MLEIQNLIYRLGARTLFNSASFKIESGQKMGVLGVNGSGKSTLFNLILGKLNAESGNIILGKNIKLSHVEQEIADTSIKVIDYVLQADEEREDLLHRLTLLENIEHADHLSELNDIHDKLNLIESHSAQSRAATILAGLGFSDSDINNPLAHFSGGWQMRAKLARALFCPADLLLLDEPTNHLDLETSIWLENYLASKN
jgi:ATP-binding cassette subfamily F protein 3